MKSWETKNGCCITKILSGRSNVFLVLYKNKTLLVDTSPKQFRLKLNKRLKQLNTDTLNYLVLTHAHFDHAGNAKFIKDNFKAQLIIHKKEAALLKAGKNASIQGTVPFTKLLIAVFMKNPQHWFTYPACKADILIDSYFDLNQLGIPGYIISTPGHTEGSISIIIDNEIALIGDTLFGIFKNSIFPPFATNISAFHESWKKLNKTSCDWFLPSHGKPVFKTCLKKAAAKSTIEIRILPQIFNILPPLITILS
jgi:glyoxylase-like metal-dependent hydrolase (beta-lactamase superfamily II)